MKDFGAYKICFSRLWQRDMATNKHPYTKEEGGTIKGSDFRGSDLMIVCKAPT